MDMLEVLPILRKLEAYDLHDVHDFARAATELAEAITARDVINSELGQMLRELGDTGWKPLLYFDDGQNARKWGPLDAPAWVAYPQGDVRVWASFRAPDPVGAVRQLYQHAREWPNVRPTFGPAAATATAPAPSAIEGREGTRPDHAEPGVQLQPSAGLTPALDGRPRPVHGSIEIVRMGAVLGCIAAGYFLLAMLVRGW